MFSDPRHIISQLSLSDGQIIADLGAGSGHYALWAAKAVAPHGKVFATDIQKDLLSRLQKEAHKNHIRNIDVVSGDLEISGGTKLKDSSCDVVIAANVLFMITDKKAFLTEIKRILKSRGRLLLVDWTASFSGMGPHAKHVVYKDDCLKLVQGLGFTLDRELDAGEHHYGMIFRKI